MSAEVVEALFEADILCEGSRVRDSGNMNEYPPFLRILVILHVL